MKLVVYSSTPRSTQNVKIKSLSQNWIFFQTSTEENACSSFLVIALSADIFWLEERKKERKENLDNIFLTIDLLNKKMWRLTWDMISEVKKVIFILWVGRNNHIKHWVYLLNGPKDFCLCLFLMRWGRMFVSMNVCYMSLCMYIYQRSSLLIQTRVTPDQTESIILKTSCYSSCCVSIATHGWFQWEVNRDPMLGWQTNDGHEEVKSNTKGKIRASWRKIPGGSVSHTFLSKIRMSD